eukprot:639846-Alexandrium_andersonii.AAC.1
MWFTSAAPVAHHPRVKVMQARSFAAARPGSFLLRRPAPCSWTLQLYVGYSRARRGLFARRWCATPLCVAAW